MRTVNFLLIFCCLSFFASGQSTDYYLQIAVYNKKVSASHFYNINENIYYTKDANDFHRYFLGKFDKDSADAEKSKKKDLGYGAVVIHANEFDTKCCNNIPTPKLIFSPLQSIFFDFDRYNLRSESKSQLNKLAKILKENPKMGVLFSAHTDAKGSNNYNDRLSKNRANSARQYLRSKGISSRRIKTEMHGEIDPIAKNELSGGVDTEEGRQLNRRVVIHILDEYGSRISEMVEEIDVPETLKIK